MLSAAIAVCEVAFWVFLVAGLAARYLLKRPALGMALPSALRPRMGYRSCCADRRWAVAPCCCAA